MPGLFIFDQAGTLWRNEKERLEKGWLCRISLFSPALGPLQSAAGNAFLSDHESPLALLSMFVKARMRFWIILWLWRQKWRGAAGFWIDPLKSHDEQKGGPGNRMAYRAFDCR